MARGGGNKGKGGGGGKKTGRSQQFNYLRKFGYPAPAELRREAQGLASAAVPTIRQVSTPFNQQIRSTRDYLSAVQSALADTTAGVNQGYDASVAQSQGVDAAANARLAGLGLGADSAGVQAVQGARGDSATQALIANAAAAKHAAAMGPTIAAGASSQNQQVLQSKLLDALANRRDQLSQAFFQALQSAQSQGLARAGFNQSQYQFGQNMALQQQQAATQAAQSAAGLAEQQREFNITRRDAQRAGSSSGGSIAKQLGITAHELYGYQQRFAASIQDAKAGVPHVNDKGQTLRNHWDVHPAPLGAPNEPNQPNSIFSLYTLLSQQYPEMKLLVLKSLKDAYPASTWRTFVQSMVGDGGPAAPASHGRR